MKLMKEAAELDIEYLSIRTIQEIINFKWYAYTKDFFFYQLWLLVAFIIGFLIDITIIGPPDGTIDTDYQTGTEYLSSSIATRVWCSLIIMWFLYIEIRQIIVI